MSEINITTLTDANLDRVQHFCGHSPTYRQGYRAKQAWLQDRLREGMRYTLLQVRGHNAGLIEYLPGEVAWRGVDARGYLFIHCFWVVGQNRGHGYGRQLLETCLQDAKGTNGVVVMVSKAHWLPTPGIFLQNGFELADHSEPSFDLLVNRYDSGAPLPAFRKNKTVLPAGLVVYVSGQCPYTQNVAAIVERVGAQLKVPATVLHVDSSEQAQAIPCPYGTLGYFFDGEFLTHRPMGTEKLVELLSPRLVSRTS